MICDNLMSESKKTIFLCYKLQEKFYKNYFERDEIFKLGKCVKANIVKVTAANFFVFGKSAVFGIIGSFATYSIIITQFFNIT